LLNLSKYQLLLPDQGADRTPLQENTVSAKRIYIPTAAAPDRGSPEALWNEFELTVLMKVYERVLTCRKECLRLEQAELIFARPAKMLSGEFWPTLPDSRLLLRELEQLGHLLGKDALAAHAAFELGIVKLAGSD
jgi:hypothetical protein